MSRKSMETNAASFVVLSYWVGPEILTLRSSPAQLDGAPLVGAHSSWYSLEFLIFLQLTCFCCRHLMNMAFITFNILQRGINSDWPLRFFQLRSIVAVLYLKNKQYQNYSFISLLAKKQSPNLVKVLWYFAIPPWVLFIEGYGFLPSKHTFL